MKKIGWILMLCLIAAAGTAQTKKSGAGKKPDYDKVFWEDSVEKVQKLYVSVTQKTLENDGDGFELSLTQTNPSTYIKERVFYFYRGKLGKVLVEFDTEQLNKTTLEAIAKKLVEQYGLADDNSPIEKSEYIDGRLVERKGFQLSWDKESSTLEFRLFDIKMNGIFLGEKVLFILWSKEMMQEIQEKQEQEASKKLDF